MKTDPKITLTATDKFPAEVTGDVKAADCDIWESFGRRLDKLVPRVRETSKMMTALHESVVGS